MVGCVDRRSRLLPAKRFPPPPKGTPIPTLVVIIMVPCYDDDPLSILMTPCWYDDDPPRHWLIIYPVLTPILFYPILTPILPSPIYPLHRRRGHYRHRWVRRRADASTVPKKLQCAQTRTSLPQRASSGGLCTHHDCAYDGCISITSHWSEKSQHVDECSYPLGIGSTSP